MGTSSPLLRIRIGRGLLAAAVLFIDGCTRSSTPVDIRTVDLRNMTVELTCFGTRTVTLRDGDWHSPEDLTDGAIESFHIDYADVTADGALDAIVSVCCGFGAGNETCQGMIYSIIGEKAVKIGHIYGSVSAGKAPGTVTAWSPWWDAADAHCCPSMYEETTYHYDGRIFMQMTARRIPTAQYEAETRTPGSQVDLIASGADLPGVMPAHRSVSSKETNS